MTRFEMRQRRREFLSEVRTHVPANGLEIAFQLATDSMRERYGEGADWPTILQMIADIVLQLMANCQNEDLQTLALGPPPEAA